jgi:hypothetical protein
MDSAERFRVIDELVVNTQEPPAWESLARQLDLPDDRWRNHDPASTIPDLNSVWANFEPNWDGVAALWLGIETSHSTYLDPIAYSGLDDTGFPSGFLWQGPSLPSAALTAFARNHLTGEGSDAYDYGASLAWAALAARLLQVAPVGVPTLVGFGGGDWIVLPSHT